MEYRLYEVPFKCRTHKILIKAISLVTVMPKSMVMRISYSPQHMLFLFYKRPSYKSIADPKLQKRVKFHAPTCASFRPNICLVADSVVTVFPSFHITDGLKAAFLESGIEQLN